MSPKVIWKYNLTTKKRQVVLLPQGHKFLSIQIQGTMAVMWIMVEPDNEKVEVEFVLRETGEPFIQPKNERYRGTYQLSGGNYIIHVFEVIEK